MLSNTMDQIKWHIIDKKSSKYIDSIKKSFDKSAFIIKSNQKRTIYKIYVDNGQVFYLKHDHPEELRHRIRSLWSPKSRSEFDSAMLLRKQSVPTVPVLGWGKKGFDSFLITKEISHTLLLKDLLTFFYISKKDMNNLLTDIGRFLRLLVEKEVKHPDLHAGNILVGKKEGRFLFYLVDLYGIKVGGSFKKRDIFRLFGWLVTILWPFEWEEIRQFLFLSGFCKNPDDVKKEWQALIKWRLAYIKSRCRKRKKKLFKDSSICRLYALEAADLIIKKGLEIKERQGHYMIKALSNNDAERGWLNSYFLSLFGIPVAEHYVWLRKKETSTLIVQQPDNLKLRDLLDSNNKPKIDELSWAIDKLYDWARMAGIVISLDPDQVYIRDKAVFPLLFSNPEQFSLII